MIAASTSYHPNRHQFKPEYVKAWDEAKPSERKKLLKEAGFSAVNAYSFRAWAFIPPNVREDVIAVMNRNLKTSANNQDVTPTKTAPVSWWKTGSME